MLKALKILQIIKGGPGSGNWGHVGRIGHRGGSQSNKNVMPLSSGPSAKKRYQQAKNDRASLGSKIKNKVGQALDPNFSSLNDMSDSAIVANNIIFGAVKHNPASVYYPLLDFENVIDNKDKSSIKNNLVKNLADKTGMSYDVVNSAIKIWAQTSNDNDTRALNIQEAASELFEVELSDWQKGKIRYTKQFNKKKNIQHSVFESNIIGIYDLDPDIAKLGYKTSREAEKAFLKAMYEETQKAFKEQGITEVVVHRGIILEDKKQHFPYKDAPAKLENSNVLESWSLDPAIASDFSLSLKQEDSYVLSMKVPVERILSTAGTGFGCASEYEVVVIGGENDEVFVNE